MVRVINFVLASNNAGSITRIVAEYANELVSRGFMVYISYPVISFWDYHSWLAERISAKLPQWIAPVYRTLKFWWYILRVIIKTFAQSKSFGWQGSVLHTLDRRVRMNRMWRLPFAHTMPDADVMIVMQNYLIPRLLFLSKSKGRIVGSIHMDYQAMIQDTDVASRNWWEQFLSIDQKLNISRFAVSAAAKTSAEFFGIAVTKIIHSGVNLKEFSPGRSSSENSEPLRVMLFCAIAPPKGQDFGCEVVRELKKIYSGKQVQFVSIGEVKIQWEDLFDENLGYLYGREYVNAYQGVDIFVYPALRDGFPAPPLEAMACGCALVTTAVQGVVEYGIHGENCLISDPGDVSGMVKNVQDLIEDALLRKRVSCNGLETVEKFSWKRSADSLIDFIEEVSGNKDVAI